jgi:N6-L-threonylcarbamoyladenine synthase
VVADHVVQFDPDRLADQGDPARFEFPRALWRRDSFDFSFSGLKTAVRQTVQGLVAAGGGVLAESDRADVAASVRQAVVDVLLYKAVGAATALRLPHLVIAGGVAANSLLRREAAVRAAKARIGLTIAPLAYCTDNAAMIGVAAWHRLAHGQRDDVRTLTAFASGPLDAEVLR